MLIKDDQNSRQEELSNLERSSRTGMKLLCLNSKAIFLEATGHDSAYFLSFPVPKLMSGGQDWTTSDTNWFYCEQQDIKKHLVVSRYAHVPGTSCSVYLLFWTGQGFRTNIYMKASIPIFTFMKHMPVTTMNIKIHYTFL